jgi:PAS domain S-box-containing protein
MTVHDLSPEFPSSSWPAHWEELKHAGCLKLESMQKTKGGTLIEVEVSTNYIQHGGQELTCAYIRDIRERKQAEKALRESEFRWKFAIEGSGDGVWDWNIQTDEVIYSRRWKEMLGYAEGDILPTNQEWVDRIHPDDRAYVAGTMQAYLEGKSAIYIVEYRLKCKDDSYKWILGRGMVVRRSDDGSPLRMIGTHTDITMHKQSEVALKESEDRFRSLMENIPSVAVQGYALDGTVLFWNQASERIYGYSTEEALGANLLDLIIPYEMKEGVTEAIRQMKESGVLFPANELLLKRKDGSLIPVFSSHALINPIGRQAEMFCLDIDLTERKRAEEQLSYSISMTNAALESTADGILIVNRDGEIVRWNQKFVDLWHVPAELLVTHVKDPALDYVTTQMAQPEEFFAKVMELYEHPEASSLDLLHLADGRLVERYSQPQKIGNEIVGRFWSFRDITEQNRHEQEQLKIDKLESLGVLAGGIAHDFNNILTGIMGNISFAQLFLDPTHKSFKALLEAEKASVRATELAHQLLTFARGGEPIKKVVSLQHLVSETISLVLHGSNVIATINIPDSIHAIEADEGQMSQVFHNIIINATQAMPGGGTLTVSAFNESLDDLNLLGLPSGSYVRLTFTDQGCGIPDDDLKKIFDPYFTTKSAGNGLGLASVHSIVSRHGGHIEASSAIGKGTTFTILLPSIGETYSRFKIYSDGQSVANHSGGSILVMDDEKMIRDMTVEMLEYLGYQVSTCENGTEAVSLYKAGMESGAPISAVIMDLTIPGGMGGKETAQQILGLDPKACLIVSSGYSHDPIMSDYSSYGFSAAMAKPYNISDLGQMLSPLLSQNNQL